MDLPEYFTVWDSYSVFRPTGHVSLDRAVQMVTSAISFAHDQDIRKLLVNVTSLTGFEPPTFTARYYFIKEWAETSKGVVQLAIVARPEMIDPDKFGVTVAVNNGLNGDVFASEREALAWLLNEKQFSASLSDTGESSHPLVNQVHFF